MNSELSQGGTIRRGVEEGNVFILWAKKLRPPVVFVLSFIFCRTFFCLSKACRMHTMNRLKSVFVLSKFIVLFICIVSSVWFTF
jgi:hypothetical protein